MNQPKISRCPVCGNVHGNFLVDHRDRVPTLQNTTLETVDAAIAYPGGALDMIRCAVCSFVWNDAFDPAAIDYGDNYNNDVSQSGYYQQHMEDMADRVLAAVPGDAPIHYVEIGCGDADFLRLVIQKSKGRCRSAVGFDPSFTDQRQLPDIAAVHKTFFGPEKLDLIPDEANIICSRHTIEHVADVQNFADALTAPMTKHGRRLLIETPDADWILKNVAFQDFFYEHCSLFTPGSISHLLAARGLSCKVTDVYDGQYMWIDATPDHDPASRAPSSQTPVQMQELARGYVKKRKAMIDEWSAYLKQRRETGPVALWGAASKGVTFNLLLADIPGVAIDYAIDLNRAKQGRYLPATGLGVISPEEAKEKGVASVVIMNPNYENEIREMANQLDWYPEFSVLNG